MRMTDKDSVNLRFMGVQPEVQFGQAQVAIYELNLRSQA